MKIFYFVTFSDLSATDMIIVSYNLVLSSLVDQVEKVKKKKKSFYTVSVGICALDSFSF